MTQHLPEKIFLIGPMGAGKTTIGRQLANAISYNFIDSDNVITEKTGVDIPTIFDFEGESGFRQREADVLNELIKQTHIVLATGGGAVTNPTIQQLLQQNGFVVYLQTSVSEQLKRMGDDKNRPLLQAANPKQQLETLMQQRRPIYEASADLIIDTNLYNIKHISQTIIHKIKANYA